MHIILELSCEKPVILPIHYNHIIQGFVYNTIDEKLSEFLHDKGYGKGRVFKLFCFSNLSGKPDTKSISEKIIFNGRVMLEISSAVDEFCESFANGLFKKTIMLGSNYMDVSSIKIDRQHVNSTEVCFKTLSPVVAYSTLIKGDGRKFTCYFQPGEEDFRRIVEDNLRKKYKAFTGLDAPKGEFTVKPLEQPRLHIVKYKDFVIKGYTGRLKVSGPQELLQMAADAGLGSKSSQGFGCVRVV